MIKKLTIKGLRGFGATQEINFSVPHDNEDGSGLTLLVGGNNTGKTTVLEALQYFNGWNNGQNVSFSEGKRNVKTRGRVSLGLIMTNGDNYNIQTAKNGGSSTIKTQSASNSTPPAIFAVPSRRSLDYEFGDNYIDRDNYSINQSYNLQNRSATINHQFSGRLFKFYNKKDSFDPLLKEILGYDLDWTIERHDNGNYYLKVSFNGCNHTSEGLGDGIWSVFTICDALYDSEPGDVIVIDEPELSLHPMYQKRVLNLLVRYSKDRQIIISTHSPYFVDLNALIHGGSLYRTTKEGSTVKIFSLSDKTRTSLSSFANNINQPHTFGTEAKEVFFLEDNIIVTEGQEDVIMYQKAFQNLNLPINGNFFGWGSGGASNIPKILSILKDLGYKKVVSIFDGDKAQERDNAETKFPEYNHLIISKDDIRDKKNKEKSTKNLVYWKRMVP